jgi:hypothetical protein
MIIGEQSHDYCAIVLADNHWYQYFSPASKRRERTFYWRVVGTEQAKHMFLYVCIIWS